MIRDVSAAGRLLSVLIGSSWLTSESSGRVMRALLGRGEYPIVSIAAGCGITCPLLVIVSQHLGGQGWGG